MPRRRRSRRGAWLRRVREEMGWSQAEMGRLLKMSQSNVSLIESGQQELGELQKQEVERVLLEGEAQDLVDAWIDMGARPPQQNRGCTWWIEAGDLSEPPPVGSFMRHLRTCASCMAVVHRNMFLTRSEIEELEREPRELTMEGRIDTLPVIGHPLPLEFR